MRLLFLIFLCSSLWCTCFSIDYERSFKLRREKKPSNKSSYGGRVKAFIKKARNLTHVPTLPSIPTLSPRKIILNKQNSELDACKVVNLCSNDGKCVTEGNEYYCECTPHYYGKTCQFFADPTFCQNHLCQNNGTCYSTKEPQTVPNPAIFETHNDNTTLKEQTVDVQYECWCKRGFYGTFCEFSEAMRHCAEESCSGHGFVERHHGNFECKCRCENHYTGDRCERVSPCRDLECTNFGKCKEDADGKAKCECPKKQFVRYAQVEVKGDNCEIIHVIDDNSACIPCADNNFRNWLFCLENQNITKNELSFLWKSCQEDDHDCYRKLNSQHCFNNGTCIGVLEKFAIDRFKDAYFLMPKCYCNEGYEGEFCQRKTPDLCEEQEKNGNGKCLNNGTCEVKEEVGALCHCAYGFKGTRCEIKDPCEPNTCGGALCVEIPDGTNEPKHACICRLDQDVAPETLSCYTPHHKVCTKEDGNSNCLNGGHCYPCALDEDAKFSLCSDDEIKREYRCICAPGFSPPFCDHKVTACTFHQCQNGGKCIPKKGSLADYQCDCKFGYNGTFCQVSPGICESHGFSSCVHGKCIENSKSGRGFSCECNPGFYGFNCHLEEEWNFWKEVDKNFWWTYPLIASIILIPFSLTVLWVKYWLQQRKEKAIENDVEASKEGEGNEEAQSVMPTTINPTVAQEQEVTSVVNTKNIPPVNQVPPIVSKDEGKEVNANVAKESTDFEKTKNGVSKEKQSQKKKQSLDKKEVQKPEENITPQTTQKKHKLRKK